MTKSEFVYTTYIKTTPEKLWAALTNPEAMKQYWFGYHQQAEWKAGAPWRLVSSDGRIADSGKVVEALPGTRLVLEWRNELVPELKAEGYSQCVFAIELAGDAVKLTVTHTMPVAGSIFIQKVSGGWPSILSNLKSLLETSGVALT